MKSKKKTLCSESLNSKKLKLCKNNTCANRCILVRPKHIKLIDNNEVYTIYNYYFYDKSSKNIYDCGIYHEDTFRKQYSKIMNKKGYLIEVIYNSIVNKKKHTMSTQISIFRNNTDNLNKKMPYSFEWNYDIIGKEKLPTNKTVSGKFKKVVFDSYIKSTLSKLKKIDYKRLTPFLGTYDTLLDAYYNKCSKCSKDIFKI